MAKRPGRRCGDCLVRCSAYHTRKPRGIQQQRPCIHISDTGHGLSTDEIAQLFTPYHRLKADNRIEGAGIGLVITRQLIELMGGELGIESQPGEGSVFSVTLDLATDG